MNSSSSAGGSRSMPRRVFASSVVLLALAAPLGAVQIDIAAPLGARAFGWLVTMLPNGNIVVQDPSAGDPIVGAIYLYSPDGTLISTLKGSTEGDSVGQFPIVVLPSGNFVVRTLDWHNGSATRAGAVTWVNGTTGLDGVVSAANSLVGSSDDDLVGSDIVVLANGGYVVATPYWSNGGAMRAGAATFEPADGSVHGAVSAANSLVGVAAYDSVGVRVVALANGNYLVASPYWNDGENLLVGAVTWAKGQTGITGTISAQNSLVGSTANDRIGTDDVYTQVWSLPNGNALVGSPDWNNGTTEDAGAVTWIDGAVGISGTITPANSLVGATAGDRIGDGGLDYGFAILPNDRYAVIAPNWSATGAAHVGAITWGDAKVGVRGFVSSSNSLIGSTENDLTASRVYALSDGNWVVGSPYWSDGDLLEVGAATWIDASAPRVGAISTENSLVGTTRVDQVGTSIVALRDGRYVIASPMWNNGSTAQVGAATWVDRTGPRTGVVSAANSLVGSSPGDGIDSTVMALTNGNYLVLSPHWKRDGVERAGAVTWARGDAGIAGPISTQNSLVGDMTDDRVGYKAVPLSNGNAVSAALAWHDGRGAATWIDGETGRVETVSAQNSLIGDAASGGINSVNALTGTGNYLVVDSDWSGLDGAVAWGNGYLGIAGEISPSNSLVGVAPLDGVGRDVVTFANGNALVTGDASVTLVRGTSPTIGPVSSENSALNAFGHSSRSYDYDVARDRLVVGWFLDNYVSIFQTESLLKDGFD
jgi:hypothetical protein